MILLSRPLLLISFFFVRSFSMRQSSHTLRNDSFSSGDAGACDKTVHAALKEGQFRV